MTCTYSRQFFLWNDCYFRTEYWYADRWHIQNLPSTRQPVGNEKTEREKRRKKKDQHTEYQPPPPIVNIVIAAVSLLGSAGIVPSSGSPRLTYHFFRDGIGPHTPGMCRDGVVRSSTQRVCVGMRYHNSST